MTDMDTESQTIKHSYLSKHVICNELQKTFSDRWQSFRDWTDTGIEIITKPFRICKISNFLRNKEFLEKVKDELLEMEFKRKVVDLYQFEQTADLNTVESEYLTKLRDVFREDVALWMELNTDITLNGKISMSCSIYFDTDYLLCHDDNLDDRRIAFILYVMDEWSVEDGGTLDLFDTDEAGCPRNVVKSIVPEYNSFVFFEVVDNSYHQVAEIMSNEKMRWSINGWFHGPKRSSHKPTRPIQIKSFIEPDSAKIELGSWISKNYLTDDISKQIQEEVEANSYIFLQSFLKNDIYEAISADLMSQDIHWQMIGPADERHYEIADEQTLPRLLKEFYNMFKSISFFQQLKVYTDLDLTPDYESMKPKMTIELQRWSQGCYTLMIDKTKNVNPTSSNENESTISSTDNINVDDEKEQLDINKYPEMQFSSGSDYDNDTIEVVHAESTGCSNDKTKLTNVNSARKCDRREDLKRKLSPIPQSSSESEIDLKITRHCVGSSNDSSDIENMLSNVESDYSADKEEEEKEKEDKREVDDDEEDDEEDKGRSTAESEPGELDLIIQFHTDNTKELDDLIDYVDPLDSKGELVHVPAKDNHLCLVYKTSSICRVHHYVNHYCKDYFYNLICTYYE